MHIPVRTVPFCIPTKVKEQSVYIEKICADPSLLLTSSFSEKIIDRFQAHYPGSKIFLTTSATAGLLMTALIAGIGPGDEVIMPSFSFVGTANPFVSLGATPVFVDIEKGSMNIDVELLKEAVTSKTKAIVPIHYGSQPCRLHELMNFAANNNIKVIEDASHSAGARINEQYQGGIGNMACISFDHQKNISCGQGGLVIINDPDLFEMADLVYENGTNKKDFLRKKVNAFSWVSVGSNFQMSEVCASYLLPQVEQLDTIISERLASWRVYHNGLKQLETDGLLRLPPDHSGHNGHIFYLLTEKRDELRFHLAQKGIQANSHYTPLHSSSFGNNVGRYVQRNDYTRIKSNKVLRLPLYHNMKTEDLEFVRDEVVAFFKAR